MVTNFTTISCIFAQPHACNYKNRIYESYKANTNHRTRKDALLSAIGHWKEVNERCALHIHWSILFAFSACICIQIKYFISFPFNLSSSDWNCRRYVLLFRIEFMRIKVSFWDCILTEYREIVYRLLVYCMWLFENLKREHKIQ